MQKLSELTPNERNPRKIKDSKLKTLEKSVREFGSLDGFLENRRSGKMISGHQRRAAFPDGVITVTREFDEPTALGTVAEGFVEIEGERFPYRRVDWEEAKEKAAIIAANRNAGEWNLPDLKDMILDLDELNYDLDLTGFDEEERENLIVPVERVPPAGDPDHIPAVPAEPVTRLGDLWILGDHRLLCGDSTNADDFAKLMDGGTAELCFTSPPYADQREYNGGKELSTEHLATFIRTAFGAVKYFAVNLGYSRKDGEVNPYWDDYLKEAKNCGLKFLSWNIWDKGECGSIGNQTAMFGISHEWIFVFGPEPKGLVRTIPNKNAGYFSDHNSTRQADGSVKKGKNRTVGDFSQMKTIYQCSAQKARDDIDHPARFPVEFPEGYIEAMTDLGDCVYEPFGGSGTTMVAAEKLGRRSCTMEIDPKYCDVIVARFEAYTGQKAELMAP